MTDSKDRSLKARIKVFLNREIKPLTAFGFILTSIWFCLFVLFVADNWTAAKALPLNAWGDFLAGLSAPLALLWLVIGYFQQGEELKLNTEALKAQQQELSNQVRETAILAGNSERQAIAAEQMVLVSKDDIARTGMRDRAEAQPIFRPNGGGSSNGAHYATRVLNAGATVTDLELITSEGIDGHISRPAVLESGSDTTFKFSNVVHHPYNFRVKYTDKFLKEHIQYFTMERPHSFVNVTSIISPASEPA